MCCVHACIKGVYDRCSSLMRNIFQSKPPEIQYWEHSFGFEECNVSGSSATNVDNSDESNN